MTKYQLAFTHSRLAFINLFAFALQFAFACQFTTYVVSYCPPALAISNFLAFTFLFTLTEFFCLLVYFYLLQQIQLANLLLSSVFFLKKCGYTFPVLSPSPLFCQVIFYLLGQFNLASMHLLATVGQFPLQGHSLYQLSVCM